ncbi:MAG: SEC-C metal-binding domain-containing protein, partial [Desulfovibrionales bacterium]
MKVGRNDPCPCGSGKKFKKCCLEKRAVSDLGYRRISSAQNGLVDKLTEYAARDLGEEVLSVAVTDFLQEDSDPSLLWDEIDEEFTPVFWPWLFYIFELDQVDIDELGLSGQMQPDMTVAEIFIEDKGHELEKLELELLESCIRKQFSFFEVEDVQPGQGFQAVNLLTGQRHWANEISASKELKQGEIIYALIVEIRGHTTIIANGQYKFYPRFKIDILRFLEGLEENFESVTDDLLLKLDYDLRHFFISLQHALFAPPELHNTDGDPLSMRTLHYEIASPEQAFQALASLC